MTKYDPDNLHDDDLLEKQFKEPIASPNVVGEEDVFSGDTPQGEPADIDEELRKVGLRGDYGKHDEEKTPAALGIGDELD